MRREARTRLDPQPHYFYPGRALCPAHLAASSLCPAHLAAASSPAPGRRKNWAGTIAPKEIGTDNYILCVQEVVAQFM